MTTDVRIVDLYTGRILAEFRATRDWAEAVRLVRAVVTYDRPHERDGRPWGARPGWWVQPAVKVRHRGNGSSARWRWVGEKTARAMGVAHRTEPPEARAGSGTRGGP